MGLMRLSTSVAIAALIAGSAVAQSAAPAPAPAAAQVASPVSAAAPATAQTPAPSAMPDFELADGVVATVNDAIITGYDLRQRMLIIIAMSQVQPTEENLPAIQQQALQALIEERLQRQEIAKYPDLIVSDAEVDDELAAMAQEVGTTREQYMTFLQQGGIRPEALREQLRTEAGWRQLVGGRFTSRARVSRSQVEQAMRQLSETASKPQYLVGEI